MASSWGNSWSNHWGNSWGIIGSVLIPPPPHGGGVGGGYLSRKKFNELWDAYKAALAQASGLKNKKAAATLRRAASAAKNALDEAAERATEAATEAADLTRITLALRAAAAATALTERIAKANAVVKSSREFIARMIEEEEEESVALLLLH